MENLSVDDFYQIINDYLRAQLFFSALKLDIFTQLDEFITAKEIAKNTGYDFTNLNWFLTALACEGFIEKRDDRFKNIENKSKLLSKNNKFYIGDSFLNSFNMMSLEEAVDLVKNGSDEYKANDKKVALYDFKAMAKASANEIKLFRAKALIDKIKKIYDEDVQFKFLDLGGGSGMMSIELAKAFPNSKGVVFDDPDVLEIAKEFILDENMEDRIEIIGGDFLTDDIGSGYDLIIACGVFHFAKSSLDNFFEKIYNALKVDGFLCSKTFTVSDDYLKPERFFTRWLSSHLRGTSSLLTSEFLEKSISKKFIEHLDTKDNRDFRIHKKR